MASPQTRNSDSAKTLVSWKEIAVFLNRAERTVKRWERERGLPVHRVPGGERGSVFAYPDELTDWLKGKSQELEADDLAPVDPALDSAAQPSAAAAETAPAPAPARQRRTVSPARVAAWVLPLALTAALILYLSGGHTDSRVTAVGDHDSANAGARDPALDSVAVLPFTNAGGDPSSDYLSDGITESLIGNLAHIPQLKVRSRDSVLRYKGKDVEVRTAGSNLGVLMVVSG